MKILLSCPLPFSLAHGGQQIQIEQTKAALEAAGMEVESMRWWDATQTADIIHYFGRMPSGQIEMAHQKGIKIVMAELLGGPGSRSQSQLRTQKMVSRAVKLAMPRQFVAAFNWDSYRLADACIALTTREAYLMSYLFDAPPERVHVVTNGIEEVFISTPKAQRGQWLVCTATLTAVKRVLELAQTAVRAQTPVWFVGQAYAESDPYAQKFLELARQHPQFIRYEGAVRDRGRLAQIYREARGFVLLSRWESLSLSALEAAACECPLLLSDLPWAHSAFGRDASYCPVASPEHSAGFLKRFYNDAPSLQPPPKPATWTEVAHQLKKIYEQISSPAS